MPVVSGRGRSLRWRSKDSPRSATREATSSCAMNAGRTVIVPLHRELARGTLASILRQAELSVDEFRELLSSDPGTELVPNCLAQPGNNHHRLAAVPHPVDVHYPTH